MSKINEISLQPSRFLVENIELLPKGQVLDAAMGSGANAVYLARMGFEVEGVDISAEAVNTALDLYMRYSDKAKDEKSKTVLHNIAEEEKTHLKALGNLMEERS
jgi:methylase of polypeptide subunit release factors